MTDLSLSNSLVEIEVLGRGLASPLVTDTGTGDFVRTEGADNVKNCIIDLILTKVGERVMNEDFGTSVADSVFESQEAIQDILPIQIVQAINRFEPRVQSVRVSAEPRGDTAVVINIAWVLRSTGQPGSLVYPFYLNPAEGGLSQV